MNDPLTSELCGGPLDGAHVNVRLGAGILVVVEDGTGGSHYYCIDYGERARLVYARTVHEPAKPRKATKILRGGLDSAH